MTLKRAEGAMRRAGRRGKGREDEGQQQAFHWTHLSNAPVIRVDQTMLTRHYPNMADKVATTFVVATQAYRYKEVLKAGCDHSEGQEHTMASHVHI